MVAGHMLSQELLSGSAPVNNSLCLITFEMVANQAEIGVVSDVRRVIRYRHKLLWLAVPVPETG